MEWLLDKGASVNKTGLYGDTALMRATKFAHLSIVTLLLERGADRGIKCREGEWEGMTALDIARERSHYEVVALLETHQSITPVPAPTPAPAPAPAPAGRRSAGGGTPDQDPRFVSINSFAVKFRNRQDSCGCKTGYLRRGANSVIHYAETAQKTGRSVIEINQAFVNAVLVTYDAQAHGLTQELLDAAKAKMFEIMQSYHAESLWRHPAGASGQYVIDSQQSPTFKTSW